MKLISPNHIIVKYDNDEDPFTYYICRGWGGIIIDNNLVIPFNDKNITENSTITQYLKRHKIPYTIIDKSFSSGVFKYNQQIVINKRHIRIAK